MTVQSVQPSPYCVDWPLITDVLVTMMTVQSVQPSLHCVDRPLITDVLVTMMTVQSVQPSLHCVDRPLITDVLVTRMTAQSVRPCWSCIQLIFSAPTWLRRPLIWQWWQIHWSHQKHNCQCNLHPACRAQTANVFFMPASAQQSVEPPSLRGSLTENNKQNINLHHPAVWITDTHTHTHAHCVLVNLATLVFTQGWWLLALGVLCLEVCVVSWLWMSGDECLYCTCPRMSSLVSGGHWMPWLWMCEISWLWLWEMFRVQVSWSWNDHEFSWLRMSSSWVFRTLDAKVIGFHALVAMVMGFHDFGCQSHFWLWVPWSWVFVTSDVKVMGPQVLRPQCLQVQYMDTASLSQFEVWASFVKSQYTASGLRTPGFFSFKCRQQNVKSELVISFCEIRWLLWEWWVT